MVYSNQICAFRNTKAFIQRLRRFKNGRVFTGMDSCLTMITNFEQNFQFLFPYFFFVILKISHILFFIIKFWNDGTMHDVCPTSPFISWKILFVKQMNECVPKMHMCMIWMQLKTFIFIHFIYLPSKSFYRCMHKWRKWKKRKIP